MRETATFKTFNSSHQGTEQNPYQHKITECLSHSSQMRAKRMLLNQAKQKIMSKYQYLFEVYKLYIFYLLHILANMWDLFPFANGIFAICYFAICLFSQNLNYICNLRKINPFIYLFIYI